MILLPGSCCLFIILCFISSRLWRRVIIFWSFGSGLFELNYSEVLDCVPWIVRVRYVGNNGWRFFKWDWISFKFFSLLRPERISL